jgi:hypothetical protein
MSHIPIVAEVSAKSPGVPSVIPRGTLIVLGALLLGETTINYIDRQVVSVLATLRETRWSNVQYATIRTHF